MEFFFNSYDNPTSGTGVLLIIRPYYFNPTAFYENEMYKLRYKKDISDNTHMVITISNNDGSEHPTKYSDCQANDPTLCAAEGGWFVKGKARLSDDGTNLSFAAKAKLSKNYTNLICAYGAGTSYYNLAFVAKKTYPNYSTAKFGWETAGDTFTLCGNATNPLNYGYFNAVDLFVTDSVPDVNPVISGYPTTAEVDAVLLAGPGDAELDVTSLPVGNISFNSVAVPF